VADKSEDPIVLLIAQTRPELIAYFKRRGLTAFESEDLTQETLMRFLRAGYDPAAPDAGPKIFRNARNHWIDFLRSAARGHTGAPPTNSVIDNELLDDLGDPAPSIDVQMINREDLDIVLAAIKKLPPKCRTAFELSRFEEYSYAEIAKRMRISKSAVEKHISEALKRIAHALEGGN